MAKDAIVEKGGLLGSQSNHGVYSIRYEVSPAGQVVRSLERPPARGPRKFIRKEPHSDHQTTSSTRKVQQ